MTRSRRSRLEALERERRAEADRPLSWGDVMGAAMRHEAAMAALPPAEREAAEAAKAAREAALRERALSGLMDPAEIDREFPPEPPDNGRARTLHHLLAALHRRERLVALVNRSRRLRGLPVGMDEEHPDWRAELAGLGETDEAEDW